MAQADESIVTKLQNLSQELHDFSAVIKYLLSKLSSTDEKDK